MASLAAYSGLRRGELAALTIEQVDEAGRVLTVDRKVVEISGQLYVEAPKNRKFRRTIFPRLTPGGYPLAGRLAARIQTARAEQEAGTNPKGLVFPSRGGEYWRSSNFNRRILQPAYRKAGWRDSSGAGRYLAQPAPCLLHDRLVHVEARRHRRVPDGRARQLPDHARHVRRHHRRGPRPSPHRHRISARPNCLR
jgi:integrase